MSGARGVYALLALGSAAFIAVGSLVPFDFQSRPWADVTAAFVRAMKWAPIAICILAMVCVTAPRRLVWERFQVVLYKNQRSFVIGTSDEEFLLFANDGSSANPRIVRKNSPDVTPDPEQWQFIVPQ